ncbi:phosphatidate cytidylyltransferase [Aliishimia ponticola]|uniref:Phosphatidate cytidylyltransferase n=1 Tax=Aliishimia ponticola TaxID=2499833 RepID=A0A4S4NHN9_9RHOB|nr:phosphatidate cytidylyltransferase [Aliishimia ponticola]THH38385.1 phosphatidate cytidylyltransferase [Aliishimia ponticola]
MTPGTQSGKWNDLTTRIGSAAVMVIIGSICIWNGGWPFRGLVAGVAGLMIWELVRMRAPHRRLSAIAVGAVAALAVWLVPAAGFWGAMALVLGTTALVGLVSFPNWKLGAGYALVILLGSIVLIALRSQLGIGWVVWVVSVIIATDIAGYFAGKTFGGPKFWPRISPKKTWSGTIAGWGGAALVGILFGLGSGMMVQIVLLSVLLSFAGQLGDIGESAIKRRSGVKDSSALIPGHGGVLDRFDALLGASLVLLVIAWLTGFPGGLT